MNIVDNTLDHVIYLTRRFGEDDLESAILAILLELGLSSQSDGFRYLRKAILIEYTAPGQRRNKMLYPAVGCHFEPQRGWRQVEYGIRTTIIAAWNHRDEDIWVYYFPENVRDAQRPSNGEFISQIACILELWRKCNKEAGHGSE